MNILGSLSIWFHLLDFFFKYVFCLYHSILLDRKVQIFYPSFFLLALFIAPCSLFFTWYILYTVLAKNFKRNLLSNPQILSWLQSCKAFFFLSLWLPAYFHPMLCHSSLIPLSIWGLKSLPKLIVTMFFCPVSTGY